MINFPKADSLMHGFSETNPYVIESYPYGRLRCQMRCWVETMDGKGQRSVRQTQNPKNGRWNAPKKSTYSPVVFMYFNQENQHVEFFHLNPRERKDMPQIMEYLLQVVTPRFLNEEQQKQIRTWYYYDIKIGYGWRVSKYDGFEAQYAFKAWTKETLKHIAGAPFEQIHLHQPEPEITAVAA